MYGIKNQDKVNESRESKENKEYWEEKVLDTETWTRMTRREYVEMQKARRHDYR